jgi:hypothetical protein
VGEACASLNDHVRTTVARMDASHCSGPIWLAAEFLDTTGEVYELEARDTLQPDTVGPSRTPAEGV